MTYGAIALLKAPSGFWMTDERMACHEAGHAVIGLTNGQALKEIKIRHQSMWGQYSLYGGYTDFGNLIDYKQPRLASALRTALHINVSGCVADGLSLEMSALGRWLTASEKRGLARRSDYIPFRLSAFIEYLYEIQGFEGQCFPQDPLIEPAFLLSLDIKHALITASQLLQCRRGVIPDGPPKEAPSLPDIPKLLPDIIRAEKSAEGILKSRWDKVNKVVRSLLRRKSGRMTGRQIEKLIGPFD